MEAVRALSHIERLSADLHLEFPEQGAIPLRLVEEIHALEKFMNCSW
jgi:hypothetical protein